jgi:hypothetical protein
MLAPARLRGELGYEFRAEGRGDMEGVAVLWGPPRDAAEGSGARRFKVTWGSKVLWRHRSNGGDAYTAAREVLDLIAGDLWQRAPLDSETAIRRVDVCLDHWGYRWTSADIYRFACRAWKRRFEEHAAEPTDDDEREPGDTRIVEGKNSATYYIGARGAASRQLRVYNKVIEAQDSGKLPWMEPAWRAHGWDGEATVWRAEIEIGGQWCQDHGMRTIADLKGCEHALWLDFFADTRHTTGRRTRNKRAPTSKVWRFLGDQVDAAAKAAGEPAAWEWEPRPPREEADLPILTSMGQGVNRKLANTLFPGWEDDPAARDGLVAYLLSAMKAGAQRTRERDARIAARASPPPPRPKPEPRPRRTSQLVASLQRRGDELAAAYERSHVPKRREKWP